MGQKCKKKQEKLQRVSILTWTLDNNEMPKVIQQSALPGSIKYPIMFRKQATFRPRLEELYAVQIVIQEEVRTLGP